MRARRGGGDASTARRRRNETGEEAEKRNRQGGGAARRRRNETGEEAEKRNRQEGGEAKPARMRNSENGEEAEQRARRGDEEPIKNQATDLHAYEIYYMILAKRPRNDILYVEMTWLRVPSARVNVSRVDRKMMFKVLLIFILSLHIQTFVINCDEDVEGQVVLELYHSLSNRPNEDDFIFRGTIHMRDNVPQYTQKKTLTLQDKSMLRHLSATNGNYYLKIKNSGNKSEITTFIKGCLLYESNLSDEITLYLDHSSLLLGVSLNTYLSSCSGKVVPESHLNTFNTTITLGSLTSAPSPDTQTFLHRLEQERQEKARGEHGENKSFFAKYWMYIVPVVIFVVLSGASGPEGGAAGGGGR
ncbi:EMC10 [Cordylochernes scorpioides]|uniref:ER membrane protein complex subunit 10 n=1 Tax=Cordylochernes scorpioides TaxID=51811 RepID=A0ABY6KM44_9ARAC|nr:EMC10 [Cordylochernes scorpioides]